MKKIILLGLAVILATSCTTEKTPDNQFTIEGEITGLESHLYFRHPDREYSREYPSDSIIVTDGKFSYTDTIADLSLIRAYTKFSEDNKMFKIAKGGGYYPVKSMYLMFFASPGANIKVTGEATDFMNAYPSGDDYNSSLATINKLAFPNFNEVGNLMVKASFEQDSVKSQELMKKADELGTKGNEERIKYIEENPQSFGALWYLEDMMMRKQIEEEKAISLFEKLPENFFETSLYKTAASRVNGITSTKEGMPVPAVKTTSTPDGKEFDIATLRGKYVLIDFWGVWCGPCVAEMPTVKAFQEKHKDKLVVLGINSGDTKEKMQNFLEENDYTWQQIMNVRDNSDDNFVTRFNVQGFPTKFIIDPDGKIVKRFIGSGEEAFTLLDELLKS